MVAVHREIRFEEAIEQHLLSKVGGYVTGKPALFDRKLALFPEEVVAFIQRTQEAAWKAVAAYHGANAANAVLADLAAALSNPSMGLLHVLRSGFACFGKTFKVAYFAPNNRMNPETEKQYAAN